ncbi:CsbD family protein [Acetobacteraceae bacterium KSS8]|uniref:CsbD family protein n=1 Tax=Endosaccharibacter trunci TaxID=2812733 RepID=A0ABT1W877_9PROT|nr:CsbD family protein [Acetobacteraceae bacterium KSS8]
MDKNRLDGVAHQVKGTLKDVAGKITGNERLQAEGKAEKAAGNVQEGYGKGKDALRDIAK